MTIYTDSTPPTSGFGRTRTTGIYHRIGHTTTCVGSRAPQRLILVDPADVLNAAHNNEKVLCKKCFPQGQYSVAEYQEIDEEAS
jgi:hypothetical protein